ncbi:MAG: hypothetical protein HDQ88_04515 [Clostridia bacterium]|nr:hypothetical protein [Clostridia bacterium]
MKKIKLFLVTLFCLICLCVAFSGCSTVTGEFIEGSFIIKSGSNYSASSRTLTIRGSFDVSLPQAGKYDVSYTLVQVDANGTATSDEKNCTTSITADKGDYTVEFTEKITTSVNSVRARLKNINVKLVNEKKEQSAYVDGSLMITSSRYSSNELYVSGLFDVKLPKAGTYKISYVIAQTNTNGTLTGAEEERFTDIVASKTEYTIRFSAYIKTSVNSTNIKIKDVTVKFIGDETGHDAYAIGFGVTGGVLFAGLITVFVLDKLGIFNKTKKEN